MEEFTLKVGSMGEAVHLGLLEIGFSNEEYDNIIGESRISATLPE